MRSRFSYLFLIPVAVLLLGAARSVPLVDPEPITVPSGMSAKDVSQIIRSTIVQRGWAVSKEENGKIDAVVNLRQHTAQIAIAYDANQIKPSYVSSENLSYRETGATRYIHPNYNKWMQNLVMDISRALQVNAITHESK